VSLILIADDDVEMRRMLGEALGRDGIDVELAADGAELRQRLETLADRGKLPQIVIADIQMPGVTGMHILAWVRRELPSVDVILITAFGDARIHARARKLGAAAVFDKPFDLDQLRVVIQKLLHPRDVVGTQSSWAK
jgi:DNA-binding NtrC family response regulator